MRLNPKLTHVMAALKSVPTMRVKRNKHHKPMMHQPRMWRTEGIVLESVKIGQYISDM
jgi:hypothetical protein